LFKKEALNVMSKFLNDNEVEEQNNIFELIDTEHKGYIACSQLREVLEKNRTEFKESADTAIKQIIESMDMNHNDIINYSEFIAATIDRKKLINRERI
jgi:calcium-dependent protein kinase